MAKRFFFVLLFLSSSAFGRSDPWTQVSQRGVLRWCGDTTGGAPYVFPDEKNPQKIIGFEMDVMKDVATRLGVTPRLVEVQWDQIVPALLRGDCDVAVNGLEITSDREKVIDFSIPYFVFTEQLTIRRGEAPIRALKELNGARVGTLSASLAESELRAFPKIQIIPYPSGVEAYKDLELGRLRAVLMDDLIAAWYAGPNPHLENLPTYLGESLYGMGVRKDAPLLRQKLNDALVSMIHSGDLERIYKPWNLWTPSQKKLKTFAAHAEGREEQKPWTEFIPLLLQGALMTLFISILSMALAVFGGGVLCYGKLYGSSFVRALASALIEMIRGTPLLIQLFLLYYGLPNLGIQLPALAAAILGIGLNYAAYEAEIYRAAILAVPKGQTDAGRSLGMTRRQTLRFIVLPQAFRTMLPPSTSDFIGLFKDTSLVSVITVTELTKAYGTAATTTYRFLELGLVTAALYFAMSYPLSVWSKSLENKRHAAFH